jgi:hypothetical protein
MLHPLLTHAHLILVQRFIDAFAPLQQRIDRVEGIVGSLEASCGAVAKRLSEAETAMKQFTEKASEINAKKTELLAQADEVSEFLGKYSLREEEVVALRQLPLDRNYTPLSEMLAIAHVDDAAASARSDSSGEGTGENDDDIVSNASRFFSALRRLKRVRKGCVALVGSRHQSAAFELLEVLSQQQERAFERVYAFVQYRIALMDAVIDGVVGGGVVSDGGSVGDVDGGAGGGSGAGNSTSQHQQHVIVARSVVAAGQQEEYVEACMSDPILADAMAALRNDRPSFFAICQVSQLPEARYQGGTAGSFLLVLKH